MSPDTDVARVAAEVFGHGALRPGQADVIADVLDGRQVVAVMPTGAGKSLCYQLPAVLLRESGGVALVVSPLIALMKDQVDGLRERGVSATALTSAADAGEQAEILDGIRRGAYALVYVAPERFRSPRFLDALAGAGPSLSLLAIDEAHCISEWGHEFRPDYRRLGEVVDRLAPPRLVALTATATPEVRRDIAVQLGLTDPRFHVRGFDRPNLHFRVEPAGGFHDKAARLVERVRMRPGGAALVYAATRKNAERYAEALGEAGMRVRVYHAGLDDDDRTRAQDEFMSGRLDAIVATNAFGMGVDKEDVRVVVHADAPRSPEAYWQEAGRGGRDGQPADCVLLWNHADVRLHEFLIDAAYPPAELVRGLWKELRRRPLDADEIAYISKQLPGAPHRSQVDSALRLLERHGWVRLEGRDYQALDAPRGGNGPALDLAALASRASVERKKLRAMIDYAYHPRCRRRYLLRYFGDLEWSAGERTCGRCDVCDGTASSEPVVAQRKPKKARKGKVAAVIAEDIDLDPALVERLRAMRSKLAREKSIPAFMIFSDRTLLALASVRPRSAADLLGVPGIGPAKLDTYGAAILDALRQPG